ncbi:hypothetical protein [Acidisoma sp. 7E03]
MSLQPSPSGPASVVIAGGLPGAPGVSAYIGAGAPAAALGNNGDSYIDANTGDIWAKSSDVWTNTGMTLIGAASEDAAALAVPLLLKQVVRQPSIIIDGPTSLTSDIHGGKTLVLQPGAQIAIDWNDTGDGFGCVVINRSGVSIFPMLSNFSMPVPQNGAGVAIAAPGVASVLCIGLDGGATSECWLTGAVTG